MFYKHTFLVYETILHQNKIRAGLGGSDARPTGAQQHSSVEI